MPAYNSPSYGTATALAVADVILFWSAALTGNQVISAQDMATSLQGMMDFADSPQFVTNNTTLDSTYDLVIANSGSAINITLPAAVSNAGRRYRIANKGAGALSVLRSGGDTIGGGTSASLAQYDAFEFISDGVDTWFQFGVG